MTKHWPSDRFGMSKLGYEGEILAKCKKCLAFYSPGYAEKAGGHCCNEKKEVRETIGAKRGREMSEIDSGGNAFPHCEWVGDVHTHRVGMSLREWYAGMALQGYRSNPEWGCATSKSTAEAAVIDSDAMILALESAK